MKELDKDILLVAMKAFGALDRYGPIASLKLTAVLESGVTCEWDLLTKGWDEAMKEIDRWLKDVDTENKA